MQCQKHLNNITAKKKKKKETHKKQNLNKQKHPKLQHSFADIVFETQTVKK